jgi:NAD(P)H-flavin reductase
MAPIVSMLADLAEKRNTRPVIFFFGARRTKDLYFLDRIKALKDAMPVLETVFALSDEPSAECQGETGLVTEVLARRMPSLKGYDAYLCGPPGMIEAAVGLLLERGVRERNIYLDAFVPSGGQ